MIELDPGHVKSRLNLARVYLETGYPEKALEHVEMAVGLDTTSGDAFRMLGRARDESGFLEESVEAYRQALVSRHGSWPRGLVTLWFPRKRRRRARAT